MLDLNKNQIEMNKTDKNKKTNTIDSISVDTVLAIIAFIIMIIVAAIFSTMRIVMDTKFVISLCSFFVIISIIMIINQKINNK